MPLIETKGAASAQGFGEFAQQTAATYIEDVFSTYLYTGNASTQTITNGIDLSGKGGLVWSKARAGTQGATGHNLFDTARGRAYDLYSNSASVQFGPSSSTQDLISFNSDGFTLGTAYWSNVNESSTTYVSWTFRKQPKFFDIVTWTGDGTGARTLSHNLGSVPGCIIVKRYGGDPQSWEVYHRSLGNTQGLHLDLTNAASTWSGYWNNTSPTATQFTVGANKNSSGPPVGYYIAYLFAHDAGGFGLTGSDNVISCGSVTADGSGNATVNLGYEPQWVLIKSSSEVNNWAIIDNMRGFPATDLVKFLFPNSTNAEAGGGLINLNSTGFYSSATLSASATYIYVAIRRGPMKVPTSGTSVFSPVAYTGDGSTRTYSVGFPTDLSINMNRSGAGDSPTWDDRLRGSGRDLYSNDVSAEVNGGSAGVQFDNQTNIVVPSYRITNTTPYIDWCMRRAPKFFDEVCYTGNGTYGATQAHNLGAVPELIIVKGRSNTWNWGVGCDFTSSQFQYLNLNSGTDGGNTNNYSVGGFFGAQPTTTIFTLATNVSTNQNSATYVAYLFATCAGVSKVGKYTGTGALQTINCGFTGGARWVMIKRLGTSTDPGSGNWYVYDSARGISSGNDPYLFLNSTAAEVTGTNYVDTTSVGFQVTAAAPAGLNANGGIYLFLAIA